MGERFCNNYTNCYKRYLYRSNTANNTRDGKSSKGRILSSYSNRFGLVRPVFLLLKCTNFGKGPANNIKAEIIFQPSGEKRNWNESIMAPNEYIRLFLPEGNIDKVCEKSATITIRGEYADIFGQRENEKRA